MQSSVQMSSSKGTVLLYIYRYLGTSTVPYRPYLNKLARCDYRLNGKLKDHSRFVSMPQSENYPDPYNLTQNIFQRQNYKKTVLRIWYDCFSFRSDLPCRIRIFFWSGYLSYSNAAKIVNKFEIPNDIFQLSGPRDKMYILYTYKTLMIKAFLLQETGCGSIMIITDPYMYPARCFG